MMKLPNGCVRELTVSLFASIASGVILALVGKFNIEDAEAFYRLHGSKLSRLEFILLFLSTALAIALLWLLFRLNKRRNVQKKIHARYYPRAGEFIELKDLEKEELDIVRIAIVGLGSVGKTSLIENLLLRRRSNLQTQRMGAYIINLGLKQYKYAAMFDGPGQQIESQNVLATSASTVVLVVDHAAEEDVTTINEDRLSQHKAYSISLAFKLRNRVDQLKNIIVLVNKRDLWDHANDVYLQRIERFRSEIVNTLESRTGLMVTSRSFSNENTKDVVSLKDTLAKLV